ncbi:MAG: dockerin type I domain-containing protein, partial [Planctomycetota bacterium]
MPIYARWPCLPTWLSFDANSRKFRGVTPRDSNQVDELFIITVTARDLAGRAASTTFQFTVREVTGTWNNPVDPLDVVPDGIIMPLDVLVIVNYLNSKGAGLLPQAPATQGPPFIDVNNDGWVSPLDALMVINYLNNPQGAANRAGAMFGGEGEAFVKPEQVATLENDWAATSLGWSTSGTASVREFYLPA